MSYGFLARSTLNNSVLISSDIEHLHFHGYAQLVDSADQCAEYGGSRVFNYFSAAPGIPLIFLRAKQFASVIKLTGGPKNWRFSVVHKTLDTAAPDALVFTPFTGQSQPSGNYGMQLRNAQGRVTFDSRMKPLTIIHTESIMPAEVPCNSGRPPDEALFINQGKGKGATPTLDWDFDTFHTGVNYNAPILSDPIFAAYSTAQACYERKSIQYWYDDEYDGPEQHFRSRIWWCFYREAARVTRGIITAGWVPFKSGFKMTTEKIDGWWGGSYTDGTTGDYPFYQATINRAANTIIVADGSIYR